MKHERIIKQLGEYIFEYSERNKKDLDYPVYSVTNSEGFCKDYFSKDVSSKNKTTYKIVPRDFFAYNPSRINVGSVDSQECEDYAIVSPLYVVFGTNQHSILNQYLKYYLKSKPTNRRIRLSTSGTVRDNLKFSALSKFPIPVPSLSVQEQIVSELDKVREVIEKKKQQVKELDTLAQSLFYEMFGDPVENEKGWDTYTLKDSCKRLYAGGDVPKEQFSREPTSVYSIPIFSNGVEQEGLYGYTSISKENEPCITIAGRGTIGYCVKRTKPFFPIIRLIVAVPNEELDVCYFKYLIDTLSFKGNGGAIPQLTIPMIRERIIPLPPLPLQQSFAEKIGAIERQKGLINRSIKEVQTLFDSRMDYYFGE